MKNPILGCGLSIVVGSTVVVELELVEVLVLELVELDVDVELELVELVVEVLELVELEVEVELDVELELEVDVEVVVVVGSAATTSIDKAVEIALSLPHVQSTVVSFNFHSVESPKRPVSLTSAVNPPPTVIVDVVLLAIPP